MTFHPPWGWGGVVAILKFMHHPAVWSNPNPDVAAVREIIFHNVGGSHPISESLQGKDGGPHSGRTSASRPPLDSRWQQGLLRRPLQISDRHFPLSREPVPPRNSLPLSHELSSHEETRGNVNAYHWVKEANEQRLQQVRFSPLMSDRARLCGHEKISGSQVWGGGGGEEAEHGGRAGQ